MRCVRPFGQIFFSIVQKNEYDVKVSRTRTFERGQCRTKVRPCGRTLSDALGGTLAGTNSNNNNNNNNHFMRTPRHFFLSRFLETGLPLF